MGDIQATRAAKAEENQDEQDFTEHTEEDQFNAVLSELTAVERYALRHMEWTGRDWVQGQLQAADADIQARKEEFDAEKLEELTQEIREEMGETSGEEEDSDDDSDDDDGDDDEDESSSDNEETEEDDQVDEAEKVTRSKGHVDINLWELGATPDLQKHAKRVSSSSGRKRD